MYPKLHLINILQLLIVAKISIWCVLLSYNLDFYAYEAKATLRLLIGTIIFYCCLYTFFFPALAQLLWNMLSTLEPDNTVIAWYMTFSVGMIGTSGYLAVEV